MIKQIPWIARKFEFNFPVEIFPVIIERLRGTSPRIKNMLENVSDEFLSRKTGDAWSIKEQVGHLYDLEELWLGRTEDFLAHLEILRAADMTNSKTHSGDHNSKNIHDLLIEFSSARNKLISTVEIFDEPTAALSSVHPRLQKPMRLVDSLFFVAEHDDHHLAKIRSILNQEI